MMHKLWQYAKYVKGDTDDESSMEGPQLPAYVEEKMKLLDKLFHIRDQKFKNREEIRQLCLTLLLEFKSPHTNQPLISLHSKDVEESTLVKLYLEGPMLINVKNHQLLVYVEFQIDDSYPYMAPSIIIKDKSDQDQKVNRYYAKYLQTDIQLGKMLSSLRTWLDHKSIIRVVEEIQQLLSRHFPFVQFKTEQPTLFEYSDLNSNYDNQKFQQALISPPLPVMQKADSFEQIPVKEMQRNNGPIRPPIQGHQIYSTNGLDLNVYNSILKEVREEMNTQANKIKKEIQAQRQVAQQMISTHESQIKIQEQSVYMHQQLNYDFLLLNERSHEFNHLISRNDKTIDRADLEQYFSADKVSDHVIDLHCSVLATKETLHFLFISFRDGRCDLQDMINLANKECGKMFEKQLLLTKYSIGLNKHTL